MFLLLPATLDLDEHLLLYPPHCIKDFERDELAYLLNLVSELPARNRKRARQVRERGGFVPISARLAQRTVRQYHQYLAYAVQTGLLETDGHYQPATAAQHGKCTGYRFPVAYQEQPVNGGPVGSGPPQMKVVGLSSKKFAAKVREHREKPRMMSAAERLRYRTHQHLLDWLDPATTPFRIDQKAALQAVAIDLVRQQADPSLRRAKDAGWKRRWAKAKDVEQYVDPTEQYNQRVNSIIRLAGRETNAVLDEVGGRLHSTLTNMSSFLRPYVYAEGHGQLISLDLANSQPYLLNLLLDPAFYSPELRGSDFVSARPRWEREGKGIKEKGEVEDVPFMLVKMLKNADQQELATFCEWTSSGQFYQRLRQAMATLGEEEAELAKNPGAVKELIFLVLFSKNRYTTPGKAAFTKLFPTVDRVIRLLKKGNHRTLPCLLQLLEARLLLQRIGKRVAQALPEVPILTIHDSLVVPLPYADRVQELMERELTALVGVPPVIKRELWGQQVDLMRRNDVYTAKKQRQVA